MPEPLLSIVEPLLQWFADNRRDLPWRQDRDPYHVWISEIMLQQTRIEAVMGYYARFIKALPDIRSLSEIADDTLMKLWEGLGYYSRARNLKKAAVMIMQEYNGVFPQTFNELKKLPGVGEYTAGAIASICFDEAVPAVDGNVLRVIARIRGSRSNVLLPEVKKEVGKALAEIMPPQSGAFNEALMELGELVCLPNGAPLCGSCPLREHCFARQKNLIGEIPVRIKASKRRSENKTVFIITDSDGCIAIEKRPDTGLLAGMFGLPIIDGFHENDALFSVLSDMDVAANAVEFVKEAKHVFTHIEWHMRVYHVGTKRIGGRFLRAAPEALASSYPLPTAFKKLLN